MAIAAGTYSVGPELATLTVKTGKTGAASKAGHNLVIEVTDWQATLTVGGDAASSAVELTADPRSLRVREGHGGMASLSDDDKAGIENTIDDEVLEGTAIAFHSTDVTASGGDAFSVAGELELHGERHPLVFELEVGDDGTVSGSATVKQSDWGMKPYSTLFGTLKVVDEVEVLVTGGPLG